VTRLANERTSFLNMNDINDMKFFGMSDFTSKLIYRVTLCIADQTYRVKEEVTTNN
jgi:hypothetical protein